MIQHLQGKEKALEPFGWSPPEAEWVALVCLHSGLFTRAQFCAYFGAPDSPAWRVQAQRFVHSLITRKLAVEETLEGLPTTTRPCRISHKRIYRALEIPNVRHRRTAGPRVLMRRLLSLDYVLDHRAAGWLPTEQEKVETLQALKLPKRLFPCRIYAGGDRQVRRYFALKMPVAIDDGKATFVYVDPGRDTDKELRSWGGEHAGLWAALRQKKRKVHIVAVARDDARKDRAKNVLLRWINSGPSAVHQALTPDELKDIARIEAAVGKVETATLNEYGGLYKAMEFRRLLLDRTGSNDKTPGNRIRIDDGQALISARFPASQDLLW